MGHKHEHRGGPPHSTARNQHPWWKGARGEWLVLIQVVLMGLVFLGPRSVAGWPSWPFPYPQVSTILGSGLMIVGMLFLLTGALRLGGGLTPLPFPKDRAPLVQTGPFALVRHPMYSGGLLLCLGYALFVHGWLTLGYALFLFAFLDLKSRREERWLGEKFPAYATYKQRVRKLIPYIY